MKVHDYLLVAILPVSLAIHCSNIGMIAMHKKLHKATYYILINLSVSDILLLIVHIARNLYSRENMYLMLATTTLYTASLLSTFGITHDRYIAVRYSLHYTKIVTKLRIYIGIISLWLFSLIIATIPCVVFTDLEKVEFYSNCIHIPIYLSGCVILTISSLYIHHIRNKHETSIKKRNIYFGVHGEQFTILQNLANSVLDIIKLNFVTAALIAMTNVFDLVYLYHYNSNNSTVFIFLCVTRTMYVLSNPVVYVLSMSELKQCYKNLFRRKFMKKPSKLSVKFECKQNNVTFESFWHKTEQCVVRF